jgi:hypothetical protein
MLLDITWINGTHTELEVHTLRELDDFLGAHMGEEITADLKPHARGLRLIFSSLGAVRDAGGEAGGLVADVHGA